jgi:outer membrane cobalamin receptor
MCIALALTSMKKRRDGQKAEEANARVVTAQRPESPSSRVPPQVSQVPSQGGYGVQNGNSGGK